MIYLELRGKCLYVIVYITRNNVREQQFLKKRRFGPHIDCENRAGPDSGLMGRKNKMWGGIAVMGGMAVCAGWRCTGAKN